MTESIDAGVISIGVARAYPRMITADGETTCRTKEWIAGGWGVADSIYNNRSTRTRNHNKCGSGNYYNNFKKWHFNHVHDADSGDLKGKHDHRHKDNYPSGGPECPYEEFQEF